MRCDELMTGDAPKVLTFHHFPSRTAAVVWRNWGMITPECLADVLHTDADSVCNLAGAMGLSADIDIPMALWRKRGYITLIRRNWELLPYSQLLKLLDFTPEKLDFLLREDDFLWTKLGKSKPDAKELFFEPVTPESAPAFAKIKAIREAELARLPERREKPFDFLKLDKGKKPLPPVKKPRFDLKMAYSYSALYGDPLLDPTLDPFPEKDLEAYREAGINAVWMQAVLYTLVPWLGKDFSGSKHWEIRQEQLRHLVKRAAAHGIKIILYLNEPRALREKEFQSFPEWKGPPSANKDDGLYSICLKAPGMLKKLEDAVAELFRSIPGLGGCFTISMSENLTHCKSRGSAPCPYGHDCSPVELVSMVNQAIAAGAQRDNPEACVIAWNWAWEHWAPPEEYIAALPSGIKVMAVSETGIETECFGEKGSVIDYSISHPGPGRIAKKTWDAALKYHHAPVAKVQLNASWELAALPYLPVPDLVERHLDAVKACGVRDLMVSWTLGGWQGGNFELLEHRKEEIARFRFGKAAPAVLQAWSGFSAAFEFFPFNKTSTIYTAPQNFGPMSLFYPEPTNRHATMVGFPYDDIDGWRGFSRSAFTRAFDELSTRWGKALEALRPAGNSLNGEEAENFAELLDLAEVAYCHFRTVYHQLRFCELRGTKAPVLSEICDAEIALVRRLLAILRRDSRIGFEASNHYFYVEQDLLEKILNCNAIKKKITEPISKAVWNRQNR